MLETGGVGLGVGVGLEVGVGVGVGVDEGVGEGVGLAASVRVILTAEESIFVSEVVFLMRTRRLFVPSVEVLLARAVSDPVKEPDESEVKVGKLDQELLSPSHESPLFVSPFVYGFELEPSWPILAFA